ncbi:MAG: DJ-1/PfpI family protein [Patescibacteria group bacterium]|nr:DJ-1/PfpI family protein [Patescibacteria group bacterium]
MAKILMIIAPEYYQDNELGIPRSLFLKAGFDVVIASKDVKTAIGALGGTTDVDVDISEVKVDDYVAIVFVGGGGAVTYFDDPVAHSIIKKAVEQGKVLGAICISPSILANADVLKGKKCTAFPTEEENLLEKGATYNDKDMEVDGKIVTASGPQAAKLFGQKILDVIPAK